MMKRILMATAVAAGLTGCQAAFDPATIPDATPEEVTRVEPLSWWTGMKTPLQLMVQGKDVGSKEIRIEGGKGVVAKAAHQAASPDYLFVDVEIQADAAPGTYYLVVKNGEKEVKYPYLIREREKGSADRASFTTADMIYLIMPDRFSSAFLGNDTAWQGGQYDDGSAVPWPVPATPDEVDREDPVARHGGDIQGIINHLDYIADLGATAIWSTPMLLDNQPQESYHGYACGDYYHIDPRFGDNALYKKFVDEAHGKGLKVIMDIVTNHCGTAHWWMDNPPFPDWYHVTEPYMQMNAVFSVYMDPHASVKDRDRQQSGWFVPSMPDMNLDNPYVLRYFQPPRGHLPVQRTRTHVRVVQGGPEGVSEDEHRGRMLGHEHPAGGLLAERQSEPERLRQQPAVHHGLPAPAGHPPRPDRGHRLVGRGHDAGVYGPGPGLRVQGPV